MERATPKRAKGKSSSFPKHPHVIGRQGDEFCPGGSPSEKRSESKSWAPGLTKKGKG